jgi:hypothetical protein
MAIPLTNAKLSEMGPDCDKGVLPLSDITLKRRAGDFKGSSIISTADLRGSVAATMPYAGEYYNMAGSGSTAAPGRYKSHSKIYDPNNALTTKEASQDANGQYNFRLTHKGGLSDAGVQCQDYGILPSGGKFQIEFYQCYMQNTSYSWMQAEVVGSKTTWLKGGNKVYASKSINSGDSWTTSAIDVDPAYPYITLTIGLFFPGRTNSQTRTGSCKGMRAYLV